MIKAPALLLHPRISFVIPVRTGAPVPALQALAELNYPRDNIEILVARGTNPSAQRNAAVRQSSGDIIYFLDDDSSLEPDTLSHVVAALLAQSSGLSGGVGGPILTHETNTPFQRAAGRALGSPFGLGPFCNRYRVHGQVRETDERELSSANLAVWRTVWETVGGFDERMFGNEENEWINRARDAGFRFVYHPDVRCRRDQRRTWWAVCRQHFHYGRGRGRHVWLHRRGWSWSLTAPVGLALSLTLLVFPPLGALPVAFYAISVLLAAIAAGGGDPAMTARLCAIFPAMHLPYGSGVLWGMGDWLWRRQRPVVTDKISVTASGIGAGDERELSRAQP